MLKLTKLFWDGWWMLIHWLAACMRDEDICLSLLALIIICAACALKTSHHLLLIDWSGVILGSNLQLYNWSRSACTGQTYTIDWYLWFLGILALVWYKLGHNPTMMIDDWWIVRLSGADTNSTSICMMWFRLNRIDLVRFEDEWHLCFARAWRQETYGAVAIFSQLSKRRSLYLLPRGLCN
jgi:hypothetical protein